MTNLGSNVMEVGADIDNPCTKCGPTTHVIIAISDGKVAKVECKVCGSVHRFRKKPAKKRATGTKTRAKAKTEPAGPSVEPDLSRPVRSYQVGDLYQIGDRLEHSVFGAGVVEQVMGPVKVRVYFSEGPKILVHGRGT